MASASNPSCLLGLPNELLSSIGRQLPNRDVKSLRLACSRLKAVIALRLDRVFLSANPRNVDVFNAIARHDVLRHQITEIVWDDALLLESDPWDRGETWSDYSEDDDSETQRDFPVWFSKACRENLLDTKAAIMFGPKTGLPDWTSRPMLSISECWALYQQLLQQQHEVLRSKAHERAFEDCWRLRRFPSVRTITITPATHGRLFYPLFETPMIRALPPGFNYPLPRGWPESVHILHRAEPWDDDGGDTHWPGFRLVTSVIAQNPHDLVELRVDSFQLLTGLNVRVFEQPCRALQDLTTITTRPSFQHLHLDLHVGGQQHDSWSAFTSGYLARMLSEAKLQTISIRADHTGRLYPEPPEPVPLSAIFRPSSLVNLRHFTLSRFHIRERELMELLAEIPTVSLQTVELSFLNLPGSSHRHLLESIRKELPWENVKVTLGQQHDETYGQAVWVDADDFLYRGGDNPFHEVAVDSINDGFGIERDVFDASFERPHLSYAEMRTLGYEDRGDKLDAIECH